MFDITTVREIYYGPSGEHHVYVYQDHEEKNIWYMVPVPTLRRVGDSPAFALTRYTKNGGGVAGVCTFEVELIQPVEARRAAEEQIGPGVIWGGFTWVGGTAFFYYDIEGLAKTVAVEPSLYGTNVAAFQITLATAEEVNTFVNAFSQGGGASPFRIEYDMVALTQLLGAEATVIYRSEVAIEYERKYKTEKDTWGNQRTILQEVKQVLQQSGAGEVKVKVGAGATPELEQRVNDWAVTTLEQQVAATVALASTMATGPTPVSATTSFERTYTTDTVIDWSTPVSTFMKKFTSEEWSKVYIEIDNRKLMINFALIGQLTRVDDGLPIARKITVTVDYPTRDTGNSFDLIVAGDKPATMLYEAPGYFVDGNYVPDFRYKFAITYLSGPEYESDWIDSSETIINITPSDFGTRQVTFRGTNVPFAGAGGGNVKEVQIDFFFAPPKGKKALVETKRMTANGLDGSVVFASYYNLPIGPAYSYKLRYVMADNSVVTSGTPGDFANAPNNTNSGNATMVDVPDPKALYSTFNLRTFTVTEGNAIVMVDLSAQYFDTQNDGDRALYHTSWTGWEPKGAPRIETAQPPWYFQAVDNTNTAYFNLQGQIFYADGSEVRLSQYRQPSGERVFMIWSDSENYSVKIDTYAINWDLVANVNLVLFRLVGGAAETFGGSLPAFLMKPRALMTSDERALADKTQRDVYAFSLMASPEGQPPDSLTRYYSLRRPRTDPQIEFYYAAQYIMKADGETRWLPETEVLGQLSVNLPPVPPKEAEPGLVHQLISPDLLVASLD